jgi:hypothetical protein
MNEVPISKSLERKVYHAMQHPYVWPEVEKLQKNEQQLAQNYINGSLKKKDFEKVLEKIQSEVPSLVAKSLPELEAIFEILVIDDAIKKDTLADMTLRYELAVSKGNLCRFSIWIYRGVRGGLSLYCATQIKI